MVFVLLVLIVIIVFCFFQRKFSYWRSRNVLHESPLTPLGNMYQLIKGKVNFGEHLASIHFKFDAPYIGFYSLWKPILIVKDPNIIKNILVKDFDKFRDRPFAHDEKADPVGYHLLFGMRDPPWRTMRTKTSPIFTSGKLKLMMPLIKDCAFDLNTYLRKHKNSVLEMKETCSKYTTDVISSCAFGLKANSFEREDSEFRTAGKRIFNFSLRRSLETTCYFLAPLLVSLFQFKFIEPVAADFLKKVFWETVKKRESGEVTPRNDLIDILINLKNEDEELMKGDALPAQAIAFFAAGHETTSSAISFTLFELCLNQDIQKRLRGEVLESIEKHGDITYEGVQEMKYLNMVIAETLRKYPLAAFIGRVATEDYKIPGHDLLIEKGLTVFVSQHGLQHDPKYFPDPKKYDPERFSDENKQKIPQYVYMPFGEGPRICIGERFGLLTSKMALAYIIKEFEIVKSDRTPNELIFNPRAPLLSPVDGVQIKITHFCDDQTL